MKIRSRSNYLNVWIRRHIKTLFKEPLAFAIPNRTVRIGIVIDFELGSGVFMGQFSKGDDLKHEFTPSDSYYKKNYSHQNLVSGDRLYFYRKRAKNYGVGLTSTDGKGTEGIMPAIEVFSLIDRIGRVLGLSEEAQHERNRLEIYSRDPNWDR